MSNPALHATDINSRRSAVAPEAPGWTEEKIEAVRQGYARGDRVRDIAARIGMGRNAVIGKAGRLGLAHPCYDPEKPRAPRGEGKRNRPALTPEYLAAREQTRVQRQARDDRLRELWLAGVPGPQIARELAMRDGQAASHRARALGLPPRRPRKPRTADDMALLYKLWVEHYPYQEIAKRLGLGESNVRAIARLNSFPQRDYRLTWALRQRPHLRRLWPDRAAIIAEWGRLKDGKERTKDREAERSAVQQAALEAAHETGFFNGKTRNEIICWKRAVVGLTLEEIGAEYGITRERVRQICAKGGVVPARELCARVSSPASLPRPGLASIHACALHK